MNFSRSVDIEASPETVWAVMSDVERWSEWTASITSIRRLDNGPFTIGSRARVCQPKLLPAVWCVIELEEGRGFSWVSRAPGIRVTGRHWMEPRPNGCRATLEINYAGLFGPVLGRMLRSLNERYLGMETAGLKKRSEERQNAASRRVAKSS